MTFFEALPKPIITSDEEVLKAINDSILNSGEESITTSYQESDQSSNIYPLQTKDESVLTLSKSLDLTLNDSVLTSSPSCLAQPNSLVDLTPQILFRVVNYLRPKELKQIAVINKFCNELANERLHKFVKIEKDFNFVYRTDGEFSFKFTLMKELSFYKSFRSYPWKKKYLKQLVLQEQPKRIKIHLSKYYDQADITYHEFIQFPDFNIDQSITTLIVDILPDLDPLIFDSIQNLKVHTSKPLHANEQVYINLQHTKVKLFHLIDNHNYLETTTDSNIDVPELLLDCNLTVNMIHCINWDNITTFHHTLNWLSIHAFSMLRNVETISLLVYAQFGEDIDFRALECLLAIPSRKLKTVIVRGDLWFRILNNSSNPVSLFDHPDLLFLIHRIPSLTTFGVQLNHEFSWLAVDQVYCRKNLTTITMHGEVLEENNYRKKKIVVADRCTPTVGEHPWIESLTQELFVEQYEGMNQPSEFVTKSAFSPEMIHKIRTVGISAFNQDLLLETNPSLFS